MTTNAQDYTTSLCPIVVDVNATINKNGFKLGEDILITISLTNKSNSIQSVWFDKPKSSTGGPAWTSVKLTNKETGVSVLEYENKAILQSQLYSTDQVKKYSYQLKPGQQVSGQFSLYDLVVLKSEKQQLAKGKYEMEITYCINRSNKISFTVD